MLMIHKKYDIHAALLIEAIVVVIIFSLRRLYFFLIPTISSSIRTQVIHQTTINQLIH